MGYDTARLDGRRDNVTALWRALRRPSAAFFVVLASIAGAAPARAQIDTGSIVGAITDQSGALLPGVTVTATQQSTALTITAVTNDSGKYAFPGLRVGQYTIAAELSGFKRAVRRDLTLSVQDRLQVDLQLSLGALNEEVVVTGTSQLLQLATADIGSVVDERQVRDLPLLGRRYAELAFLTPGVVVAPAGITSRGEDTFFNANGNYATWNNYTLDGADNNSFSTNLQERSPQVVQPPVDALQEFKVQTRTYSVEFGKSAGAVINASIKQGTNAFHGNLYEFARSDAFNANTWENNRAGKSKGPYDQNIPGFTLGGPLLPNRLFFFGDYQLGDTNQALSQTATVPTARMRTGDLSELAGAMVASNPFVPAGCVNASAKQVAASCIDPRALKLVALYPMPNVPGAGFFSDNYLSNGVLHQTVNQFDYRTDLNVSARDRAFARYSFQNTRRAEPPLLDDPIASGDFASNILNRGQNAVGGWSRVIGSSAFNEFRFGYNRVRSDSVQPSFGIDADTQYGITGVPRNPDFYGGLPHMPIARFTRIGGPFFRPQFQTSQAFQFSDTITWTRGAHNYKIGGERRRDLVTYIDLRSLNGELSFNDGRYTGFGFGDFLLGLSSAQRLTSFHQPDLYSDSWQGYAQDTWRARPNLTINYGLRYEYFTPMFDRNAKLTNVIPGTGQIVTAQSSGSVYDRTLINPNRNDWAPRVGASWQLGPSVLLRGGWGIFYQQFDRYGSESQLGLNLPQLVDVSITANSGADAPAYTFAQGFTPLTPDAVDKTKVQWRIQDPNQQTPIVYQFSAGPEWQLSSSMVAAAEYVASRTRHGRRLRNLNQGVFDTSSGATRVVFPYAQFGFGNAFLEQIVTNGNADYDALQLRMQRRLSNGLAFTAAYTYSHANGDFLDHLSAGGGAIGNNPQDTYNMAADYGPLPFDVPHRLVTSFIYELPWGRGRRFPLAGIAGALARDWAVNGILAFSSGLPFTATATDVSGAGPGRYERANCVGTPLPGGFDQTLTGWFDTTAFAQPAANTFGNCTYDSLRGPSSKSANLSVFRSVPIAADKRLEFRIETFNIFNWVNFGFPGANVSNANTFGRISTTLGDPRQMQFAAKFYF